MKEFYYEFIKSPLGSLLAIGDERALYFLEFSEKKDLSKQLASFKKKHHAEMIKKANAPIKQVQAELEKYFSGTLKKFKTPLYLHGTEFQKRVWKELKAIPYGQTKSYLEIAQAIGKPTAFRAVALANSVNPVCIIVPCHRVINHNGKMGGYAGGLKRKAKLLELETL